MTGDRSYFNLDLVMTIPFKQRSDLHLIRKIWHCGAVLVLYFIWTKLAEPLNKQLIYILAIGFIVGDLLRVYVPALNRFFNSFFRIILRDNEENKLAGTTYLLCGLVIIMNFFSFPVVSLSILFLAFADPFASFIGIKFGKTKIMGGKSLEGFLAAFLLCSLIAGLFFHSYNLPLLSWCLAALGAGLIGAVAELVPISSLDDNLTMPIISAIGLHFLFTFALHLPY